MIKNIVFDMGRVLIAFDPMRFIKKVTNDPADMQKLYQEIFLSVEWIRTDRGEITQTQLTELICPRLPEHLRAPAAQIMEEWVEDMPPIPGTEELARDLKAAGYHLYLLSNTCDRFYSFRRLIPALRYFDGEFVSADWHLLKPDAEIFRAFYQHFHLIPSECFFLDDMPLNIEAAARTGMQGYVFLGDVRAARTRLEQALGKAIPHAQ